MKIRICTYIFFLILSLVSCTDVEMKTEKVAAVASSDLQLDHLNIWVKDPKTARKRLTDIGFTAVPDSLSAIHDGQGTAGRYFHFLNGYLELIFVFDQEELEQNNSNNTELDFVKRANFEENGANPFSIALKVKDYDIEKIPFEKIRYNQEWMDESMNIYVAKNSNLNLNEPSIFVVYPKIESEQFETISDLKNIPDEYAFAREFYKHPNGAKKITKTIITSTEIDANSETMRAANGIENVSIKSGKEHLMEIYFDNNVQKKSFDLRPELPLIIYL